MNHRHHERRPPTKNTGFSWGRFPMGDTGIVAYRLFRRDESGALHMLSTDFRQGIDRQEIARRLRVMRRELRDQVDEVDLAVMGVAA